MDYSGTYSHSSIQFNLAHHKKNAHYVIKRRLWTRRLANTQNVIKIILLNQGAPAQITMLFQVQGCGATERLPDTSR